MKRIGNIWADIIAFENLHRAAYQVLRGKRGQVQAGEFHIDLEDNLFQLHEELKTYAYEPGPYRTFWISDPKPRLISAAPFRDRVVHHALVNIIEPIFERRFINHSYACRTGKGTHKALDQFVKWSRSTCYCLKMDIRKFFPSLDHEVLKEIIRRSLKDTEVLWVCDLVIDHSNEQEPIVLHFPGDDLITPLERRHGLPIGNLTSQFFANVYLDRLDHFIKDRLRVKRYLRYVDDFCIFHDDKSHLTELREDVLEFLFGLRLSLNEGKSRIRQLKEGIEFLGFVIHPDYMRLNQRGVRRQRKRMKQLQSDLSHGVLVWDDVKASLQAWNAHAEYGDTWRLREMVFRETSFKLYEK